MRIISKRRLQQCWERHSQAKSALEAWYDHVSRADWKKPQDVQRDYGPDAVLPDNWAVFNIKGNQFRIVTRIHYNTQIVYIRFVDTHAEYSKIKDITNL